LIFSAKYKLSTRNAFKSIYILGIRRIQDKIGIRDRIGNRILDIIRIKTCRGLKARSTNFVNTSVILLIDELLRNMFIVIRLPRHISIESSKILIR